MSKYIKRYEKEEFVEYYNNLYKLGMSKTEDEISAILGIRKSKLRSYYTTFGLTSDCCEFDALLKKILLCTDFDADSQLNKPKKLYLTQLREEAQKKQEGHRLVSEVFRQRELQKSRTRLVETLQKVYKVRKG